MAKATPQNLKDAGFIPEMFGGETPATWDGYLTRLITDISGRLSARLGTIYSSTDPHTAAEVTRSETLFCIAELWDRRITRKLAQAQAGAEPTSTKWEMEQRDRCLDEAAAIISDLTGGDYAGGVLETEPLTAEVPDA